MLAYIMLGGGAATKTPGARTQHEGWFADARETVCPEAPTGCLVRQRRFDPRRLPGENTARVALGPAPGGPLGGPMMGATREAREEEDEVTMASRPQPDVILVGGGIIGCAVAFFLAKGGARPLVLERGEIGAEASAGAAGMLTAQAHADEPDALFELKLASRDLYPSLVAEVEDRTDLDVEYRPIGHLVPTLTAAEATEVRRRITWQQARGLTARWLDAAEARSLEPGLLPAVQGGGWFPDDHHLNNTAMTQALAGATRRLGGEVRAGCPVLDLLREGDRVTGVLTREGPIPGGRVVLCAGAWSQDFEAAAGIPLPIIPAKGHIAVARLERPALRRVVYGDVYIVPRASGEHILGSTVEFVGFDKQVAVETVARLLARATALAPALREADLVTSWACLRPAAADGLPVLGAVPGRPGLVVATGHFRNGILLAPITGKLIAELLLHGGSSRLLEPFRPDRTFPPGPPLDG
jgi:glycine oxidase